MTYVELCALVQDTVENTFTEEQLALFCQQTEQKAYNTVQPPVLRETQALALTASNPLLSMPAGYLYTFSLAVVQADGAYEFLLNKDVGYIRSAYPKPADSGLPKVYAQLDADTLILGPTPDDAYSAELQFAKYPESIVTAGTSWLGDTMDAVLFNGMCLEAARFLQMEADIITLYGKMFDSAVADLKQLADAKLRQDTYRTGQVRTPVR